MSGSQQTDAQPVVAKAPPTPQQNAQSINPQMVSDIVNGVARVQAISDQVSTLVKDASSIPNPQELAGHVGNLANEVAGIVNTAQPLLSFIADFAPKFAHWL